MGEGVLWSISRVLRVHTRVLCFSYMVSTTDVGKNTLVYLFSVEYQDSFNPYRFINILYYVLLKWTADVNTRFARCTGSTCQRVLRDVLWTERVSGFRRRGHHRSLTMVSNTITLPWFKNSSACSVWMTCPPSRTRLCCYHLPGF